MGSWYETCILSHLHIMDYDDVVLFILEENNNTDLFCWRYNNKLLPIFGKYNGYGGIESIKNTESWKYIKEKFNIKNEKDLNKLIYNKNQFCLTSFVEYSLYKKVLKDFKKRIPIGENSNIYNLSHSLIDKFLSLIEKNNNTNYKNQFRKSINDMNIKSAINRVFGKYSKEILESDYKNKNIKKLKEEIVDCKIFKEMLQLSRRCFITNAAAGASWVEGYSNKIIAEHILNKKDEEGSLVSRVKDTCVFYSGGAEIETLNFENE